MAYSTQYDMKHLRRFAHHSPMIQKLKTLDYINNPGTKVFKLGTFFVIYKRIYWNVKSYCIYLITWQSLGRFSRNSS